MERKLMVVLWGVDQHRTYLWGRRFTLTADCSALTGIFKSQSLSSKLHRWALLLIEYDMDLELRPGSRHHLPDVLSRLPRFEDPGEDVDESFRMTKLAEVLTGTPKARF